MNRSDIVQEARSWLGIRWRHQGRSREGGVDCLGFPVCVAKQLNISSYDISNYSRRPEPETFLRHFENAGCQRINANDAKDGDLLIFRQSKYPCHVAIQTTKHGQKHIIHASMSHKKVVEEQLPDPRGSPGVPLVAVYRMPGVED